MVILDMLASEAGRALGSIASAWRPDAPIVEWICSRTQFGILLFIL